MAKLSRLRKARSGSLTETNVVKIELRGVSLPPRLATRIERRLAQALSRIQVRPVTARVAFADDDGPKGGPAVRCAVTVSVPRRPAIHVEAVAGAPRMAFDRSFAALERRLTESRARGLDQSCYPKKYFAAKRLLAE